MASECCFAAGTHRVHISVAAAYSWLWHLAKLQSSINCQNAKMREAWGIFGAAASCRRLELGEATAAFGLQLPARFRDPVYGLPCPASAAAAGLNGAA